MLSSSTTSCVANPVCEPMDMDIPSDSYNNTKMFRPILTYNGDPSLATFVFESGYLGAGSDGVLLEMTKEKESRISTTTYMVYGEVSVKIRSEPQSGVVSTFALLSNVGDSALWQFSGNNGSRLNTHYFSLGKQKSLIGREYNAGNHFSFGDFHTYGIRWSPDTLQFTIDGKVARSEKRQKSGSNFPFTPARVQLTTWATSDSTDKSVRTWAGTPSFNTDSYKKNGFYAVELAHLVVDCEKVSLANLSTTGIGEHPVAYYYTKPNSNGPNFSISRDNLRTLNDPVKGASEGLPGYPGQKAAGPRDNMWTGGGSIAATRPSSGSSDDSGVGNGVKIGVPVGIGAVIFVIAAIVLIVYYVRRSKKERRRRSLLARMYPKEQQAAQYTLAPEEEMHHIYNNPDTQQMTEYPPRPREHEPYHDASPPQKVKEKDYYYQDPFEQADISVDIPPSDDDDSSDAHDPLKFQHYAGHDDIRRTNAELRRTDRRRAREVLREAAFGDDDNNFFKSKEPPTDTCVPVRRPVTRTGPTNATYSRGGAVPHVLDY